MSDRDPARNAGGPRRSGGSIVLRCAIVVATAQLASFVLLAALVFAAGVGPLRRAWAIQASQDLAAHHAVIHQAAELGGFERAVEAARRLSDGPRRHDVVPLAEVDWSKPRQGIPGTDWRAIEQAAAAPEVDRYRIAWVTTTDPDAPAPPIAVFSVSAWPMPTVMARDPAAAGTWLVTRFVISALVGGLVAVWLTRPVLRLRSSVARFAAGSLGTRPDRTLLERGDEFGDLAREIDAMSTRIEGLVGAHRELLDDVAHELRSPLSRINVAIELVGRSSGEDARLDRIRRESERLGEMVDRLLVLSSLEHAIDDHDERSPVRLDRLLEDLVEDGDFEAAVSERRVQLQAAPDVRVLGHAEMLRSAIENVIRNGIRHSPPGGTVDVELRNAAGHVSVVVRDRGPGVPDGALDSIFRPFARAEPDRSGASGGRGLGLAIAERAIRAHAGTITARNHPDGGLEVRIELPEIDAARGAD